MTAGDDRPITVWRVAVRARDAFRRQCDAAPRGTKGDRLSLLRRAAVHAATGGRYRRLTGADGLALADTWHLLGEVIDGAEVTETAVEVVFHLPDGDRRVPWAEVHEEIPATRSERGAS